jgi:hypothetical protein
MTPSLESTENRRSLGYARDDKKERVAVRRGSLPRDRALVKRQAAIGAAGTGLFL